jgi:hypothetical protein
MPLDRAVDQELQRLSGKPDGPILHLGLSDFPNPGLFCPTGGRRVCNSRLLRSNLRGQNPE